MPKTDYDFSDEIQGFIAEQVAAGHFGSEAEVVETAVKLFEYNATTYHKKRGALQEKLDKSMEQARRGETVNGRAFMDDMLTRLKAQASG